MIEALFTDGKKIEVKTGEHVVCTDQSKNSGGDGSAPEPFDVFLASLLSCSGVYAKVFCDARGVNSKGMRMTLETKMNRETKLLEEIEIRLHVSEDFPVKYESALMRAMSGCTVKKQLRSEIKFDMQILRSSVL